MRSTYLLYLMLVLIVLFAGTSGCKKAPQLAVDNEHDPLNETYKVPPPKNFRVLDNNSLRRLILTWDKPAPIDGNESPYISGYLLHMYDPDQEEFIEVEKIRAQGDTYSANPKDLPLQLKYRLFSYIRQDAYLDKNTDEIVLSEPVELSVDQSLSSISAELISLTATRIQWVHSIYADSVRLYLEKSVNGAPFQPVADFEKTVYSFIDQHSLSLQDKLTYRMYASADSTSTDTLSSTPIALRIEQPDSLELIGSSDTHIDIAVRNPLLADGFQVTTLLPNSTVYDVFDVPKSDTTFTYITIDNLPNTEEITFDVKSRLQNQYSQPITLHLEQAPYLDYQKSIFLPSEDNFSPKLSPDGSKIVFLSISTSGIHYYYADVWDVNTSQRSFMNDNAQSPWNAFYFDGEYERIYMADQEYIKGWDVQGNEVLSLNHYSNREVLDMIVQEDENKAVIKYDDSLSVYNIADNTMEEFQLPGDRMLLSGSGDFVFVYKTYRDFFIQSHELNNFQQYSRLTKDVMPAKVLTGPENDIMLIYRHSIEIYDAETLSLRKTIEIETNEIYDAFQGPSNSIGFLNGPSWDRSINFYDLDTGEHLGEINMSEFERTHNIDVPSYSSANILYSKTRNEVFMLGFNHLAILTLTQRWITYEN